VIGGRPGSETGRPDEQDPTRIRAGFLRQLVVRVFLLVRALACVGLCRHEEPRFSRSSPKSSPRRRGAA